MTMEFDEPNYQRKLALYLLVYGQMGSPKDLEPCLAFSERLYDFLIDNRFGPMAEQIAAVDGYACEVGDDVEALTARVVLLEQSAYQPATDRGPKVVAEPSIPLMGPEYAESMEWIDPPPVVWMPYSPVAAAPSAPECETKSPALVGTVRTQKQMVADALEAAGATGATVAQIVRATFIKSGLASSRLSEMVNRGEAIAEYGKIGEVNRYWAGKFAPVQPVKAPAPAEQVNGGGQLIGPVLHVYDQIKLNIALGNTNNSDQLSRDLDMDPREIKGLINGLMESGHVKGSAKGWVIAK